VSDWCERGGAHPCSPSIVHLLTPLSLCRSLLLTLTLLLERADSPLRRLSEDLCMRIVRRVAVLRTGDRRSRRRWLANGWLANAFDRHCEVRASVEAAVEQRMAAARRHWRPRD